jgi:prepilin-type N-terminal cleavage/methylation domain-containing protein
MHKGFTLVELSIVLVIIGLIVGGVVGGQSLIESAKRNSVVAEVQGMKMHINAFDLQYDALPGDFTEATDYWGTDNQNVNGDGDWQIEWTLPGETYRAFQHIALADIGRYELADEPNNYAYPVSSIGGGAVYLLGYMTIYDKSANYISLGKGPISNRRDSAVTVKDAVAIDKKMDDGVADKGDVLVGANSNASCTNGATGGSGGTYTLSDTSIGCTMYFNVR